MSESFFVWAVFICLFLEQFFAVSEGTLISLDRIKLKHLADNGNKNCVKLEKFLRDPSIFLSTTLIGGNLCVITSTVILTGFIVDAFGEWGYILAPLFISPFLLLFGEIIPKTYSYRNSQRTAELIIRPLLWFSFAFSPIIKVLVGLANIVMRTFNFDKKVQSLKFTREDLLMFIKMDQTGSALEEDEKKMIDRIFDFRDITVKEVMVPLINVKSIEKNESIAFFLDEAKKSNFSRYPVFEKRVDNIIGILNVFDLFYTEDGETKTDSFVRPAYYVPETKSVDDLMREFQKQGIQIAVVVDEYGSSLGIATLEDILEEVVGEIRDEYDEDEKAVVRLKDGVYIFDAQMEIDTINERFNLGIAKGDYETLGGFLINIFEKIPIVGEKKKVENNTFTVMKANKKKIQQVMVKNKKVLTL